MFQLEYLAHKINLPKREAKKGNLKKLVILIKLTLPSERLF